MAILPRFPEHPISAYDQWAENEGVWLAEFIEPEALAEIEPEAVPKPDAPK